MKTKTFAAKGVHFSAENLKKMMNTFSYNFNKMHTENVSFGKHMVRNVFVFLLMSVRVRK